MLPALPQIPHAHRHAADDSQRHPEIKDEDLPVAGHSTSTPSPSASKGGTASLVQHRPAGRRFHDPSPAGTSHVYIVRAHRRRIRVAEENRFHRRGARLQDARSLACRINPETEPLTDRPLAASVCPLQLRHSLCVPATVSTAICFCCCAASRFLLCDNRL